MARAQRIASHADSPDADRMSNIVICILLHIPIGIAYGFQTNGNVCLALSAFLISYFGYAWADGDAYHQEMPIGRTLEFLIIAIQPVGLLIYLARRYRLKSIMAYAFYVSLMATAKFVMGVASLAAFHVRYGW